MYDAAARSAAVRIWRRGKDLELMHRSMGLAALGFLTLVPLLIVVAAVDPAQGQGFAEWLGRGLGVSMGAQREVAELFASPRKALESTTAFGLAALAVFGLTFGAALQTGYEKAWEVPAARWHTMWRHAVWLAALIGYLFASAQITQDRGAGEMAFVTSLWHFATAILSAVLFFWWSQRLLLGGRVQWRALLPGAVLTALGLVGLRVFSQLVFSPLIASNAVAYGAYGTVLVVQSWLVGVSVVVFGGAVVGRLVHEEYPRLARLLRGRRRT
ncbi:YhjD/YihY/BrkB family envelope integrity protein [Streptomyces cavernicola]|uniref:YhjD/YihY/BrkB family envelope integrity protein n=1 Tax=Streptomyces cavernicola TaxID=3043613 RepID=A0ABT6SEN6_9ACTN|nr:YhjD/YihY/BrkB family envelope integrity protein [Streptomyces sp. B-S-A6]MDI3405761.1 YhjD/YihY/BrkB family envelope integrity protein [Streptomyces sp. B-S-A6]